MEKGKADGSGGGELAESAGKSPALKCKSETRKGDREMNKLEISFRGSKRLVKAFSHITGTEYSITFWNGDTHTVTIPSKINCWISGSHRIIKAAEHDGKKWAVECWNGDKFRGVRVSA